MAHQQVPPEAGALLVRASGPDPKLARAALAAFSSSHEGTTTTSASGEGGW